MNWGCACGQGRRKRGDRRGSCPPPPPPSGGGAYHFAPPPRNIEWAPRKICEENARNSITPNITLAETEQVRKIGTSRLPKRAPPIQGHSPIGLPTPKLVCPLKYTAKICRTSQTACGQSSGQSQAVPVMGCTVKPGMRCSRRSSCHLVHG